MQVEAGREQAAAQRHFDAIGNEPTAVHTLMGNGKQHQHGMVFVLGFSCNMGHVSLANFVHDLSI